MAEARGRQETGTGEPPVLPNEVLQTLQVLLQQVMAGRSASTVSGVNSQIAGVIPPISNPSPQIPSPSSPSNREGCEVRQFVDGAFANGRSPSHPRVQLFSSPKSKNHRRSPLLGPKDVPRLTLDELVGLEAQETIADFCRRVEYVAEDPQDRWEVATSRMDRRVSTMVKTEICQLGEEGWEGIKRALRTLFVSPITFEDAWSEFTQLKYDVDDNPRWFLGELKAKFAALEGRFGRLPGRDKTMKEKMFDTLPRQLQAEMKGYMFESCPIDSFVKVLDRQRIIYLGSRNMGSPSVRKLHNGASQIGPVYEKVENERGSRKGSSAGSKKANVPVGMNEQSPAVTPRPTLVAQRRGPYCGYCRTQDHTPDTCPLKPPKGSCWDCLRMGCRRFQQNCPGRQARAQYSLQ